VFRLLRTVPLGVVLLLHSPARADELGCALDDALSQAAAALLLSNDRADAVQLTRAARAAGSDAVSLHALFVKAGDTARMRSWLADLRSRADVDLICGLAESDQGRLLIASAKGGSLAPMGADDRVVRGSLAPSFDRPELVIASAGGALTRLGASERALVRGITLGPEFVAPIDVQLVARGPLGPRPVAERTIPPRTAPSADDADPATPGDRAASGPDVAKRGEIIESDDLAAMLAQLRRARGRPRIRDNRLLREAATAHARRVCREGRVAHELAPGGGPEARLADVGLSARVLGEAIARAANASAALAAFERSPSHLLTLLDPRFTDVGVGRARDELGKSCFVVLLCAWPRYMGH
jgi:uncharacterized protein YkwD